MSINSKYRSFLLFYVAVIIAVYFILDKTASTWSFEHLHRPVFLESLTHIVDRLRSGSVFFLVGVAFIAVLAKWTPGYYLKTASLASIAILVSYEIKDELKYFFGRTWPETWTNANPSWIKDKVFGFNILHGGQGWGSFPSGHTTQIAALATVIWLRLPNSRWLSLLLTLAVAVGLWGSDYHFVSDILAGGLVGIGSAVGIVNLLSKSD